MNESNLKHQIITQENAEKFQEAGDQSKCITEIQEGIQSLKDDINENYCESKIDEYIDYAFKFGILRQKSHDQQNEQPEINNLSQISFELNQTTPLDNHVKKNESAQNSLQQSAQNYSSEDFDFQGTLSAQNKDNQLIVIPEIENEDNVIDTPRWSGLEQNEPKKGKGIKPNMKQISSSNQHHLNETSFLRDLNEVKVINGLNRKKRAVQIQCDLEVITTNLNKLSVKAEILLEDQLRDLKVDQEKQKLTQEKQFKAYNGIKTFFREQLEMLKPRNSMINKLEDITQLRNQINTQILDEATQETVYIIITDFLKSRDVKFKNIY